MKALIQRVTQAQVAVEGKIVGKISNGLLVLVGVEKGDSHLNAQRLADKLLGYRVFADAEGKMNASVQDVEGELLVVSQFTLAADTRKGRRPSFSSAAAPENAKVCYQQLVEMLKKSALTVETGHFGTDMQVSLCNDGPVTFLLTA